MLRCSLKFNFLINFARKNHKFCIFNILGKIIFTYDSQLFTGFKMGILMSGVPEIRSHWVFRRKEMLSYFRETLN